MHTIRIDDDVFRYLQTNAISYVETEPNQTLRRLFKLDSLETAPPRPIRNPKVGTKKPKANLLTLQRAGFLHAGEPLYLHDYSGARIEGAEARVSGPRLLWNAESQSMSHLAALLLKQHGYESDSVRGPAHWYTATGVSVKDLWEQFRKEERTPGSIRKPAA